jgi:hypothetical protein
MTDLVLDAIDILLPPGLRVLLKGAETLFGGHKPQAGGGGLTPSQRVEQMLNETPPPGPVTPPGGSGGLRDGLDRAGEAYQQAGGGRLSNGTKLVVFVVVWPRLTNDLCARALRGRRGCRASVGTR